VPGTTLDRIPGLPYDDFVAARKSNNKKETQPHGGQIILIFWLVFIIVIISVFMLNAETIQRNFGVFITRMTAPSGSEEELLFLDDEGESLPEPSLPERIEAVIEQPPQQPSVPERQPDPPVVTDPPARPPTTDPQPQPQPPPVPPTPPVQTRDRPVYYTQVNSDGQILQTRVTRRIPVSQSPMLDSLNVLLEGPSTEELNRGIVNLIPQGTRILSTTIRGSTAYISFSEDFLFNTFGVEGYVAQLRQIVWTVTEFSNVNDVQILIEGRRMDYLGEGIWIGSPISRQSF